MKTAEELIHEASEKFSPKNRPEEAKKYEDMLRGVLIDKKAPTEALNLNGESLDILYAYAYQLYNSGKYQQSLLLFTFLSLIDSANVTYRMGIAASMQKNKDYQNAIDAYLTIVPMDPYNPLPLFHAADCWLKLDKPFEAACFLQVAVAQAKKNPNRYPGVAERAQMSLDSILKEFAGINNK